MSAVDIRSELNEMLERADDKLLKAVHSIVTTYLQSKPSEVIGYEMDGTEVTIDNFLVEAEQAIYAVNNDGEGVSIDQLKLKSDKWLKDMK